MAIGPPIGHNPRHYINQNDTIGRDHRIIGATTDYVPRITGPTTAAWMSLNDLYALSGIGHSHTLQEIIDQGDTTVTEAKFHGGIEISGAISAVHEDNNIAFDFQIEKSMTPDTSHIWQLKNIADNKILMNVNAKGELGVGYGSGAAGFPGYMMGFIATDTDAAHTGGVFAQVSHQDGDKNLSFFHGGIANAMIEVSGGMAGNYAMYGQLGAGTCAVDTPDESHAVLAGFMANVQRNSTPGQVAPNAADEAGYYSYGGLLGNWRHACGFWHNQNTPGYYAAAVPTNTPAIYSCFHGQVNAATAHESYGLHIKHRADDGYFEPITPSDSVAAYLEWPLWGTRKSNLFLEPSGNIFTDSTNNIDGDVSFHDGGSAKLKGLYEYRTEWKKLVSSSSTFASGNVVVWDGSDFVANDPGEIPRFATIYAADATGTQTIGTTPVQISGFTDNGSYSDLVPDHTTDTITVGTPGNYFIGFQTSFVGTASTVYKFHLRVNDLEISGASCQRAVGGSDIGSASFVFTTGLSTSDTLSVYIEADAASRAYTPSELQLTTIGVAELASDTPDTWVGLNDTPGSITADHYVKGNFDGSSLEMVDLLNTANEWSTIQHFNIVS
ncbi:MAG: hypothetical protein ACXAEN_21065, partial [Candidatus Thorarchaeota archaeon]